MHLGSKIACTRYSVSACVLGLVVLAYIGPAVGTAHAFSLKTTKTGQLVRWSESAITLRVDPKLEALMGKQQVRAALAMASDAWRGLPGVPEITVSDEAAPGYTLSKRTNGVYLMEPWPFPKDQLAVTVSTYATNGRMIGADVLINGDVQYALLHDGADRPEMSQHDLGAVLTHELGHVLGLDESPDDESATMWPYIRAGEVHQRTLSDDDEQGVIEAYAGAAPLGAAVGCGQASVAGVQSISAAAWAWPLALVGLVARRRTGRAKR
jgi:predicted Zn-dependent protease